MSKIKQIGQAFIIFFPYELRRFLFRLSRPRSYQKLQLKRTVETQTSYSIKSFDEFKCIFVHIPKCAGLSISKSLFGNLGGGHISAKRYQLIFKESEFKRYFKFTFVRNPWDRLFSAYHFLKEGGFSEKDRKWSSEHLSKFSNFNDFVNTWLTEKNINSQLHFMPQYYFICDYDNTLAIDFLGFFENLEKDFLYIKQKIGVQCDLGVINKGRLRKNEYKKYYTKESIEKVAYVYRKDIHMLGYNFNNSSLELQLTMRRK